MNKKMLRVTSRRLGIIFLFFILTACDNVVQVSETQEQETDFVEEDTLFVEPEAPFDTLTVFEHLKERGVLVAVTNCADINYNIYNAHPAGFQYELLRGFCGDNHLKLEIVLNDNLDSCFSLLDSGKVDVVATGLGLTNELKQKYFLTNPIFSQKSVLVQRMPKGRSEVSKGNEKESQLLRSPLDLAGKTVHVSKSSHAVNVLQHLSEDIGATIHVVECDTLNDIGLMRLVQEGRIDYLVVDEYVARMGSCGLNSLDTKLAISVAQPIGWAVKQAADSSLLMAFNDWITGAEQKHLRKVMTRYIQNGRYISSRREASNHRLSSYDGAIKKTAAKIGWDWRLLASLIYQESRFKVDLESDKGAFGLMQLMPSVMRKYGIDYNSTPQQQLEAGGKLISFLDRALENKVTDSVERVKFVLAAYNAGLGHVYDAQRLAKKYGKSPDLWDDNVDYFILNKSKYYNDTCCKCGYLRGRETYRFVEDIMDRYHHYQALMN